MLLSSRNTNTFQYFTCLLRFLFCCISFSPILPSNKNAIKQSHRNLIVILFYKKLFIGPCVLCIIHVNLQLINLILLNNMLNILKKSILIIRTKYKTYQFYFGVLGVTFSLIYSLSFCFYGLDFTDSFFYINNSISGSEKFPLWIGTSVIGKFVASCIGSNLIHFRVVNWIAYMISAILPFLILTPKEKLKSNLIVLAFTILCLNVLNFNVFGIDGFTILFLSINSVFFIRYLHYTYLTDLLFAALFSAILVSVRFPNIIVIPIFVTFLFLSICFKNRINYKSFNNFLKNSIIYVFVSISILSIFYILFYNKLNFLIDINNNIIQSVNSGYSLKRLIGDYIFDFKELLKYIGFVFLLIMLLETNFVNAIVKPNKLLIQVVVFLIFYIFIKYDLIIDPYGHRYSKFVSATSIIAIIYLALLSYRNNNKSKTLSLTLILCLSVVAIVGSNTGLLKLSPFLLIFSSIMFVNNEIKLSNFSFWLFFTFAMISIQIKPKNIYEDAPMSYLTFTTTNQHLTQIRTTQARANFINDVMEHYDSLTTKSKNIIFWGRVSHLFHFLTSTSTNYSNSFYMSPQNIVEIKQMEQLILSTKPIVFFVPQYPIDENPKVNLTLFEEMLINNNFKSDRRSNYIVFHSE
jgi:hypothetical protein